MIAKVQPPGAKQCKKYSSKKCALKYTSFPELVLVIIYSYRSRRNGTEIIGKTFFEHFLQVDFHIPP